MLRCTGLGLILLATIAAAKPHEAQKAENEIGGTVSNVDTKLKQFAIALADKTERVFQVTKDTKFVGPRGAEHEDGLRDDAMSKGSEVRVVPAADEKVAKIVKLSAAPKGKKAP